MCIKFVFLFSMFVAVHFFVGRKCSIFLFLLCFGYYILGGHWGHRSV